MSCVKSFNIEDDALFYEGIDILFMRENDYFDSNALLFLFVSAHFAVV